MRLHERIIARLVAQRACLAVCRYGAVDESWMPGAQCCFVDAEAFCDAGAERLHEDVGMCDLVVEPALVSRYAQIERNTLLVTIG